MTEHIWPPMSVGDYIKARMSLSAELRVTADTMEMYNAVPPAELLRRAADLLERWEPYTPGNPANSTSLTDEQAKEYKAAILKNMRPKKRRAEAPHHNLDHLRKLGKERGL